MEVDSGKVAVGPTELVKSHLNYGEDSFEVLKPSIPLGVEHTLVSVEEPVVIDSDDAQILWQGFKFGDEPFLCLIGVRAVVLHY